MKFDNKPNWISLLLFLGSSLAQPVWVEAFLVSRWRNRSQLWLRRDDGADAVYATNRDGREVKLTETTGLFAQRPASRACSQNQASTIKKTG